MTELPEHGVEPELTLGWRIQMAMKNGQLAQQDLVEYFEVSRETVSRWCRDLSTPKKFVINEIARICGVSPRWLMHGETAPRTPPTGGGGSESPLPGSNRGPLAYLVPGGAARSRHQRKRHFMPVPDSLPESVPDAA